MLLEQEKQLLISELRRIENSYVYSITSEKQARAREILALLKGKS
jgi:hypothetical protein